MRPAISPRASVLGAWWAKKDRAMPNYSLQSAVTIARHPIHPMVIPFPIVCFVGTLLTDLAYWASAEMMWADFSAWLVTVGFILGVVAAIIGLIDFLSRRAIRARREAWLHFGGNVVVLVLALFNMLVHSRDAWTSVVPLGLILSALTVAVLLFTGWMGWALVHDPLVRDQLVEPPLPGETP
jgi:uncharacterized membrane protein